MDRTSRVGFLGFDGVCALDLLGPLEAFSRAISTGGDPYYETVLIGLSGIRFISESGVVLRANSLIEVTAKIDTLIIPGGAGARAKQIGSSLSAWLATQSQQPRRIASIATGIYALAQTGWLDGRQVATHWRQVSDVARVFPKLRVSTTASFLRDGSFYTCGGGRSGVEMAIYLIKEDFGTQAALAVAREMEIHLRPPGDIDPSFDRLDLLPGPSDRLADLPAFIATHLDNELSVEVLAARAALSRRHFNRLFRSIFDKSPAEFVEQMRLAEARRRLLMSHYSIASAGFSVGYKNPDAFRRAFERHFGSTPIEFRNRFQPRATNNCFRPRGTSRLSVVPQRALLA